MSELPEDIKGWVHSLEAAERNYRSLAGCSIPIGECPWSESDHAEARIIVALLDARDRKLVSKRPPNERL